ncbi:MAG: DNA-binding protein [Methanosarcinaceae archaeon]|nr:DNA-binding protein [Methanosarcinaceae archaeon]NKQ38340.1 DNA-binding protein [Methanosarcinales archaeon]
MEVILDTNGLMIPVQFKVDIFEELRSLGYDTFIVPTAVMTELDLLIKNFRGVKKIAANVARTLARRCDIVNKDGVTDDVILELAIETNAAVLTNDVELKNRLCENNIKVIYLRKKNRLAII